MYPVFVRACVFLFGAFFVSLALADIQTRTVAGVVSVTDWSNSANAASIDGACAFPDDLSPAPVLLTDWGFTIPPGSVINGISVTVRGASTAGTDIIQLIQGGTAQGSTFDAPISGGSCPGSTETVGSASELWGLSWTAADINAGNFGVSYDAEFQGRQFDGVEITVDYSASNPAPLGTGAVNTAMNNNSVGITVPAGSNRVLIATFETIGNPSSATFNGMNLTEIGAIDAGISIRGELWGLVLGTGPEIVGTITAAGFNTSNSWNVTAGQAFQNINQATPWEAFTAATTGGGSGSSSIMVASEAGDIVFDAIVGQGNGGAMSAAVGAGQTQSFNGTTGNGLGAGSSEPGAASTTMSWDFVNFLAGAHMGINLNGVPAGANVDLELTSNESIDPVIAGSGANNLVQQVVVTNNGPDTATGVDIFFSIVNVAGVTIESVVTSAGMAAGNNWMIPSLANGASETLTVTYTVDSSALAQVGAININSNVNAVNETDTDDTNDATSVSTSIDRLVDIALMSMESIDPVVAGSGAGNLTHTITATNNGPSDASGVAASATITFPAGVNPDSVVPSGSGTWSNTNPGTWTIGNLASGASATLTVTFTVDGSAAAGTDVIDTSANVSAVNETDSDSGNDATLVETSIGRSVDVGVVGMDSIDPVIAGSGAGNLTHTYTVSNAGPSNASGVELSVSSTPPAGATLDSTVPSTGSFAGGTWTLGDLAAGGNATIVLTYTVGPSSANGEIIGSTAEVTATNETDTNPGNDSSGVDTLVERQIDLVVTKTDDPDPVVAGFEIGGLEYVVTVTNNGPSDGDGVVINDPAAAFPAGVTLESAVASAGAYDNTNWVVDLPAGATETLTMTVTVGPTAPIGDDAISNTAAVTGSGGGETIINTGDDSATQATTVIPTTATWTVTKDFLDDSTASVTATLSCDSGTVVTPPVSVSEGSPQMLTVEGFLMGPFGETTCTVTESDLPPDYFQVSASADCEVDGVTHLDEFDCEFVNAPIQAKFVVTKDFSDDNPAPVQVVLECNTGLPLMQNAMVSEFGDPFDQIVFVVGDFEIGTLDCDVFESPIPEGYEETYAASNEDDALFGSVSNDDEGCHYTEIQTGTFNCDIIDTLLPVVVTVNKQWVDENPEFQNPLWVNMTLRCENGDIVNGYACGADECIDEFIDPANPGSFEVFPDWDGSTACSVSEEPEAGVLQDLEDCAQIALAPGVGGECTLVNTRLYAGIPTLSQYGFALLVLLMLGMGAVAYRRLL